MTRREIEDMIERLIAILDDMDAASEDREPENDNDGQAFAEDQRKWL